MKFVTFFIIMWTIMGFAWVQAEVPALNKSQWYKYLEAAITAPVYVWNWFKIAVKFIKEKINAKNN